MSELHIAPGQGDLANANLPAVAGQPKVKARSASEAADSPAMNLLKMIFSFPAMLGMLLVGATLTAVRSFNLDPDVWWHIKVGQTIVATHLWPTGDPYSFTVFGQPWLSYEWLGDVVTGTVAKLGGVVAMEAFLFALGSAIMLGIYALGTLRSGKSKAGMAAASLMFILATVSFSLRPQMVGYLFLIVTLLILESFRQGDRRWIWLLPALMLVWVNAHGSWIIGLGTIFVYAASGLVEFQLGGLVAQKWSDGDRLRIETVFLLCLSALPITPYGTGLCMYPFDVASNLPLNIEYIKEWQSMPFHMIGGKIFLVMLLGFVVLHVIYRFTWRLEEFFLFLLGTAMACIHVRFLLIFVPFFTPLLAVILARWIDAYDRRKDKFVLNAILMAATAVAIVHYFPSKAELNKSVQNNFPVLAVEYLNSHDVPGPMYDTYGFGGYLVYSRGPEHKVFIDGRGELYEHGGLLNDYLHISMLKPGAMRVLESYGVRSVLIERSEALATLLDNASEWKRVYSDDLSVLYVRGEGAKDAAKTAAAKDVANGADVTAQFVSDLRAGERR